MSDSAAPAQTVACSTRDLPLYFLRLGALGFGGPIALAGYVQKDLAEERRWIAKHEYVDGLALAQLSPGPLAGQLLRVKKVPEPIWVGLAGTVGIPAKGLR